MSASSSLSRRDAVKRLGVIGFSAAAQSWITAAHGAPAFTGVPPLDGTLHVDVETCTAYAQDFGAIVHEQPLAVLKPGSVDDVVAMLGFARRHGIRIVGRGRAHTAFGQAQVAAGIVIDISTLQRVRRITDDEIEVDAGMRWSALLKETLQRGRMPPALTDYIGQTVGGTLSVGGIGGMTQGRGLQVDHVTALDVVGGTGERFTCSAEQNSDLFEAVLAGQGQVGVIVGATMKLVPAPRRIRIYDLVYASLGAMLADMRTLMDDKRVEFQEAFAIPQGDGWLYLLQAGNFYSPPAQPPAQAAVLRGLHDTRADLRLEDHGFEAFANRVPAEMAVQPHPWIDLMLPAEAAEDFVAHVQQTLRPVAAGDSFSILLIPMRPATFTRPLFRAPVSTHAFGFGILRYLPPGLDAATIDGVLAYNRSLFERSRSLGGTHYPISALRMDRADWVRHYGNQFDRLAAAKRRFDPANLLAGGPDIF
jgi:cytokinin dehydrogenase